MAIQILTQEIIIRIIVIAPQKGRLDAFEAPALRKACDKYLEQGVYHFVFDLSQITMLDSAGLAVLVSVLKRARLKDGDVRLIFPMAEEANRVLKLTKFDQVFKSIDISQIVPKGF